jgi:predicted RNA-binding protein YlxR (DUF448 family)
VGGLLGLREFEMGSKHVPQRTCVACRRVKSKRELVRVVRSPDGNTFVDETGKANGRGAYLCRDRMCWEKAIGRPRGSSSGSLAHSLKVVLSEADRSVLLDYAQRLPDTTSVGANRKSS